MRSRDRSNNVVGTRQEERRSRGAVRAHQIAAADSSREVREPDVAWLRYYYSCFLISISYPVTTASVADQNP
jgi:hypothetical protein